MKKKLHYLVLVLFAVLSLANTQLNAQKWTGKGDGTSWNDPANWDSNEVPAAGATVKINKTYTITGTMPNAPAIIKILKDANIIFDLDMNIGDGVEVQHGLSVAGGSNVTLGVEGHDRVFTFKTPKHALAVFNNNDNVSITVAKSSTLNIDQAGIGINIGNVNSTFTNNGVINLTGEVLLVAKINGTFVNNGTIDASNIIKNGLTITGTFDNKGMINLTSQVDTTVLIRVDTFGVFSNSKTMNFTGGKDTSAVTIRGTYTNAKDAYMTMNSADVNVTPTGVFTNAGLVSMGNDGLFYTQGTTTNNGFYAYASGGAFSTGVGTIIDNGLPADAKIDANKDCAVDIAEEAYTWYFSGDSLGVAGADGSFTFPAKSVPSDSVMLTTSLDGVNITVVNVCDDAVEGGCSTVSSPVSLGDQAVCEGTDIPALKVEEVAGYEADWYDAATEGTLLHTGWEYTPAVSDPGIYTYYVENRDADGCVSDRTAVSLKISALPVFSIDSTKCSADRSSYTVFLNMDVSLTVEAGAGTVDGTTVTGIPAGTDVVITVTDPDSGCSTEQTVTSPDCTTATEDLFKNNKLYVYPTIINNSFVKIDLQNFDQGKYLVEFIDISGKIVMHTNVKGGLVNTINTNELSQGMYIINLRTTDRIFKARVFLTK